MTSLLRCRLSRAVPLVVALLAVQTGCGAGAPPPSPGYAQSPRGGEPATAVAPRAAMEAAAQAPAPPPAPASAPAAPAGALSRAADGRASAPPAAEGARSAKSAALATRAAVIIYQGDLRMTAEESAMAKTIDLIIDVAEGLGGHLASRKDQSVQIKVPSASFREAMTRIDALGGVVGRSVTADDVSEEFHDLEVRLVNLRATRARLQEFLAKAAGIQDMLTVERELERVAQEIDRMEGRLEFLRTRAAMSAISVALTPKPKVTPIVAAPPPAAPLRPLELPVPWVAGIGLDPLLSLRK